LGEPNRYLDMLYVNPRDFSKPTSLNLKHDYPYSN